MNEADSSRVIRVDRAIRCCQNAVDRAVTTLYEIAKEVLDGPRGSGIALAPPISVPGTITGAPRVIAIPAAGVLAVGAVVIVTAAMLDAFDREVGRQHLSEVLTQTADAISLVNRTTKTNDVTPCSQCMRRNALGQYPNIRKSFTTTKGQTIQKRI